MRLTVVTFALLLAAAPRAAQAPPGVTRAGRRRRDQANYVVGPEDVLTVTVFNEPQLSGRYRVENDGHFNYPFLGRVNAGGATIATWPPTLKDQARRRLSAQPAGDG